MNIFRNILVGLASLVFIIAITGFVYLFTLQTTVMDRAVVKSWLSESQLYDGRLTNALVQATNAGGGPNGTLPATPNALSPSPEVLKTALAATFTPEFTQTQIEGVVNNAYDWIDGTSPEFSFSIPIDQKRDTLIAELSKAIQPQIAALPVCQIAQSGQASVCRPSNISVEQLASQLTTDSINQSGAFTEPITQNSFSSAAQPTSQPTQQNDLSQLPEIRKYIDLLLLILPIATVVSLAIIILATVRGKRIARAARLSRRVFFSMLFIFLPTILVVWFAKDTDFGLSNMFTGQTGELLVPLIKTIGVGILGQLALITGIITAISVTAWIILSIANRNKSEPVAASPATVEQQPPVAPQPPYQPAVSQQSAPQPIIEQPSSQPITPPQQTPQQPAATDYPPTNYQK